MTYESNGHVVTFSEIQVDNTTGHPISITTDHHHIHEGYFFEAFKKMALSANGGVLNIGLLTPVNAYVHYRKSLISTTADNLTIDFFESATLTGGTILTPVNHNRNNSNIANSVLKDSPTISNTGTQIASYFLGGSAGVGQSRGGAELGESNEWVLKSNTQYLIRFTNGSTAINTFNANFVWYEEL